MNDSNNTINFQRELVSMREARSRAIAALLRAEQRRLDEAYRELVEYEPEVDEPTEDDLIPATDLNKLCRLRGSALSDRTRRRIMQSLSTNGRAYAHKQQWDKHK